MQVQRFAQSLCNFETGGPGNFHAQCPFMTHFQTKLHMLCFNGLSFMADKLKAKYGHFKLPTLFKTLEKITLTEVV
jgi:hypothetical protein